MEERSGVLVQNEKHANKSVAKVMRITFLIFSVVFLLNVFGIFAVDMKIMTLAYVLGTILLWIPTIIAILISTAVCDVLSYLVKWYLEKEEADKINRRITEHRKKKAWICNRWDSSK